MAKAAFTYELRNFEDDALGIEDYVVRAADGEAVGTVAGLLERGSGLLLAVESAGAAPGLHDRRVVQWSDVEEVDHDALAVWLRLSQARFERAPELDPDAVRAGEEAEARRVLDLPPELEQRPERSAGGPIDRTVVSLLPVLGGAVAFGVLVVVAAATAFETPWLYLGFVVPVALAAAVAAVAYRAWRKPYELRGAKKP